jgi:hypothetical protein
MRFELDAWEQRQRVFEKSNTDVLQLVELGDFVL